MVLTFNLISQMGNLYIYYKFLLKPFLEEEKCLQRDSCYLKIGKLYICLLLRYSASNRDIINVVLYNI